MKPFDRSMRRATMNDSDNRYHNIYTVSWEQLHQDTWILFPWDSEVRFTEPIIEQRKQPS